MPAALLCPVSSPAVRPCRPPPPRASRCSLRTWPWVGGMQSVGHVVSAVGAPNLPCPTPRAAARCACPVLCPCSSSRFGATLQLHHRPVRRWLAQSARRSCVSAAPMGCNVKKSWACLLQECGDIRTSLSARRVGGMLASQLQCGAWFHSPLLSRHSPSIMWSSAAESSASAAAPEAATRCGRPADRTGPAAEGRDGHSPPSCQPSPPRLREHPTPLFPPPVVSPRDDAALRCSAGAGTAGLRCVATSISTACWAARLQGCLGAHPSAASLGSAVAGLAHLWMSLRGAGNTRNTRNRRAPAAAHRGRPRPRHPPPLPLPRRRLGCPPRQARQQQGTPGLRRG